jgi:hypothetical protein
MSDRTLLMMVTAAIERWPLQAAGLLALLPLVLFGLGLSEPPAVAKPEAMIEERIVPTTIQTEGITERRQDDETFRRRWDPILSAPPAIEVRRVVAPQPAHAANPVPGKAATAKPPTRHRTLVSRPARLDICAKHHMRRVTVQRGKWTGWRCRH